MAHKRLWRGVSAVYGIATLVIQNRCIPSRSWSVCGDVPGRSMLEQLTGLLATSHLQPSAEMALPCRPSSASPPVGGGGWLYLRRRSLGPHVHGLHPASALLLWPGTASSPTDRTSLCSVDREGSSAGLWRSWGLVRGSWNGRRPGMNRHTEHDSCPRCGSAEIATHFERSNAPETPQWLSRCSACQFKWSEA